MERDSAKEKGRKKLIRDRASALKEAPARKAPARSVMKQAGRYHAIETAKKQLLDARQAVVPDQEQQPYTANDKVESYTVTALHDALRALPSAAGDGQHAMNPFHGETDSGNAVPDKPTPKEQMRQAFIRQFREQKQQEARRAPLPKTQDDPPEIATCREKQSPAQVKTKTYRERAKESVSSIHATGQRRTTLPRNPSSGSAQKAQIVKEQGRRLARDRAIQEIRTGAARNAAKAGNEFFRKLGATITKSVTPSRETLLYGAGLLVLIVVPFLVIMGVASMLTSSGEGRSAYVPVNEEVEAYRPLIRHYAAQHGIPEYEDLIAAVMMQESGGQGTDPMQCSESGYNTEYPRTPGGITDPEYSIDVGAQALADVLSLAGVESPIDLDGISLALQGYNYGSGYISWARSNYGGYSELNAIEYSDMMAVRFGWAGYGDKAYVSHVLRYYPIGRSFMGEGNAAMVAVAQTQIGNEGGLKYCEWYGYPYRVEWCAIFVSWCAEQCGYLDAGVLPKELNVIPYVEWFREREQWQGRDYEPIPGDLIFYDWESDGLADHVGIVERVEDGIVYSIEGNAGDRCIENSHTFGTAPIYGYGLPAY